MLAEWTSEIFSLSLKMVQADAATIGNLVVHDAVALAQHRDSFGWAGQVQKCFVEHGRSSPVGFYP